MLHHEASLLPEELEETSRVEYSLTESVLDGCMGSDVSKELEITSILRVGSDRGAQLVVVNNEIGAKIYALYYNDTKGGFY
jgi:hypothetical protein